MKTKQFKLLIHKEQNQTKILLNFTKDNSLQRKIVLFSNCTKDKSLRRGIKTTMKAKH